MRIRFGFLTRRFQKLRNQTVNDSKIAEELCHLIQEIKGLAHETRELRLVMADECAWRRAHCISPGDQALLDALLVESGRITKRLEALNARM